MSANTLSLLHLFSLGRTNLWLGWSALALLGLLKAKLRWRALCFFFRHSQLLFWEQRVKSYDPAAIMNSGRLWEQRIIQIGYLSNIINVENLIDKFIFELESNLTHSQKE